LKNKKLKETKVLKTNNNGLKITVGDLKIPNSFSMTMEVFIFLVADINFLDKKCPSLKNGWKTQSESILIQLHKLKNKFPLILQLKMFNSLKTLKEKSTKL